MDYISLDKSLSENKLAEEALNAMRDRGVLSGPGVYEPSQFEVLRAAVRNNFLIPWTSVTPAVERVLYASAAIRQPKRILAIGVFCGNTLIWNIGACAGPAKAYDTEQIVGVDIDADALRIARKNLDRLDINGAVELRCENGLDTIDRIDGPIDYLYLDATDPNRNGLTAGKKIYRPLLEKVYPKLAPNALVAAHDMMVPAFTAENGIARDFIAYVDTPGMFSARVTLDIDPWGLGVFVK